MRFWLRLVGVTALVFVVLYTTPGSLRARVVSTTEDGQILRRTGTQQTVNRGSLLFGGDCIESGVDAIAIIYELTSIVRNQDAVRTASTHQGEPESPKED